MDKLPFKYLNVPLDKRDACIKQVKNNSLWTDLLDMKNRKRG